MNIGSFSNGLSYNPNGYYDSAEEYEKEFLSIKTDYFLITENSPYFMDGVETRDSIYRKYKYYISGKKKLYNCNACLSKTNSIELIKEYYYVRAYQERYFIDVGSYINDNLVHFIVTHLDWEDINVRRSQIDELLQYLSGCEYFVLCGDFNPDSRYNKSINGTILDCYQEEYELFKDFGCNLANCGEYGEFNTIVKYEGISVFPWDNIITSSNIIIDSVDRINIVLSDHYPLQAQLHIE